jgi:hypothetical protein
MSDAFTPYSGRGACEMNVTPIAMNKADALKAFQAYQAAVRADRTTTRTTWKTEDVALMQAYKHLAKGTTVLDLQSAMMQAGSRLFDGCPIPLPRLAIVPSDAPQCFLELRRDGGARFGATRFAKAKTNSVRFPGGTFPEVANDVVFWRVNEHATMTPIIPPQLRPKHDLANYRTLWEVEQWTQEPPKDPMLLKPLGGMLYAVLATWDLTEMERAVLRGRAR